MNPLEQQLMHSRLHPQVLAPDPVVDPARLAENLATIGVELDSPRERRLVRVLRRLGMSDLDVPLVAATPALRRSWFLAVFVALFFALSATTNQTGVDADRIVIFLTLAPLVPLMGVALAFGSGVDPTHDLVLAAPRDTFTVFLVRALTVLIASSVMLLLASILLPEGGIYRIAWLLPALAVTAVTMAFAASFDPRRTAAAVGIGWVVLVVIVSQATSAAAMFGIATQITSVVVAAAATAIVIDRRGHFDGAGSSA